MHAGCECNVVIATCPQRDLESTFLRCDNVAFTTLPQPKHNVVTTLSQRDFVCWEASYRMLISRSGEPCHHVPLPSGVYGPIRGPTTLGAPGPDVACRS